MSTKHRKTRIAVITTALVIIGALAFAAFVGRAPIQGGVTTRAFNPQWAGASVATADGLAGSATVSGGIMTLTVAEGYPGGTMEVQGSAYVSGNSEQGKIVGISLPGLPAGWTAQVIQGCGQVLNGPATPTDVTLRLTMTEQAAAGSSGTFTGAGLLVQPQSVADANPTCPVYAGS